MLTIIYKDHTNRDAALSAMHSSTKVFLTFSNFIKPTDALTATNGSSRHSAPTEKNEKRSKSRENGKRRHHDEEDKNKSKKESRKV